MMPIIQGVLLAAFVVLAPIGVSEWVSSRRRKRLITRLRSLSCQNCGCPYGEDVAEMLRTRSYRWNPGPGNAVWRLKLPSWTYVLGCPQCSTEVEFWPDGKPFERPDKGLRGCTRIS